MASGTMERILRLMAEKKASDVYLSAHAPAMIKINGQTLPVNSQVLPPEAPLNLLSEIVPASRIEELTETGELNMAIPLEGVGNFRLSAMRQRGSYAAVLRFVPMDIPTLESLNVASILSDLVMEKRGLILMAGATGAGKTTTLAAMIDLRNESSTGHILTIEDPIEYVFRNKRSVINQREIGPDTVSLQVGLRNALRQAPDVIMIGEIRDRETMSAAIAYAQSGHLCLATLHANNSYQALNRILSFYPVEVRSNMLGDLAAALRSIVSQRLLRTHTGGRVPATEVLLNTALIKDLIQKADFFGIREAMEKSTAVGSQSFEQDLARLVQDGLVSRNEGLAHADSPNNLLYRLQNEFNSASPNTEPGATEDEKADAASFTEFTLDVKH
jgi:twitching motility protein PilU